MNSSLILKALAHWANVIGWRPEAPLLSVMKFEQISVREKVPAYMKLHIWVYDNKS